MAPRVLHILGTAQLEGHAIARIVADLAAGLSPDRYEFEVWFLGGDGPLAGQFESHGVHARVLDWRRGMRDPVGAARFWRALRARRFALVHHHFGGRSVRWLARRASGAPLVVHLHERVRETANPVVRPISLGDADAVIANSRAVAGIVRGAMPEVIYPGVPPCPLRHERAAKVPGDTIVIGTAGRLVPIKGTIHLLRAFAILRDEFPAVRVEIAGVGPERASLAQAAHSLGIADRVAFLGWQDDLAPAFARWDVFVQPSIEEGFGVAALEAMAAGLPTIATNAGGLPELVDDGRTGLLVPMADPDALARAIRTLVGDPSRRLAMGAAAHQRAVECFPVGRMAASIAAVYDRLLGQAPP
jgi:glycosyltransferase involved in cell wall biosynthesis